MKKLLVTVILGAAIASAPIAASVADTLPPILPSSQVADTLPPILPSAPADLA